MLFYRHHILQKMEYDNYKWASWKAGSSDKNPECTREDDLHLICIIGNWKYLDVIICWTWSDEE